MKNLVQTAFTAIRHTPFSVIDLTHTITPSIATWIGKSPYELLTSPDYKDKKSPFKSQTLKNFRLGIGTHIDSPAFTIEHGIPIHELPLDELIFPGMVIDVSAKADEKFKLSGQDVKDFENKNGHIPHGTCVIIRTGWDRYWNEPEEFQNKFKFPSIGVDAAEILLNRNVSGIAVDTMSPDREGEGFPVHKLFLGQRKFVIKNIANGNKLPTKEFYIFAMPLKFSDATQSPIRCFALIVDPDIH